MSSLEITTVVFAAICAVAAILALSFVQAAIKWIFGVIQIHCHWGFKQQDPIDGEDTPVTSPPPVRLEDILDEMRGQTQLPAAIHDLMMNSRPADGGWVAEVRLRRSRLLNRLKGLHPLEVKVTRKGPATT